MQFSRRFFLKSSGLTFVGLGFVPQFLERALAQSSNARGKILVVIFQRGAADSLSMVPPFGDPQYYAVRPTTALSPPATLLAFTPRSLRSSAFGITETWRSFRG